MRGIIKNLLHNFKSVYLRTLMFNNDTRIYFYATLREYLKSQFSLLEIFNQIQQQSKNPALQEVAKLSKKAIRNNQPFASHYYRTGLFTNQESNLLILGERYSCMETITDLLLDQDNQSPVLLQILSNSIQWIFMSLVITAMAIYTLPYLQKYTEGYTLFFEYVFFVKTWWPYALGLSVGAMFVYHWCCYRLTGPVRVILTACGCFRVHAMLTERRFLKISSALISTRLPPDEYLRLMETTFAGYSLFRHSLQRSRSRLKEASLLQVLHGVLSGYTYSHVLSCTPNQTPGEIANGFNVAGRMLNIRLARTIKTYQVFYTILFLTTSIAVTIPFALVSMGMGIEI